MSKKDDRIAELEAEVSRLQGELAEANKALVNALSIPRTFPSLPCTRPHSDELFTWTAPPPPYQTWCTNSGGASS